MFNSCFRFSLENFHRYLLVDAIYVPMVKLLANIYFTIFSFEVCYTKNNHDFFDPRFTLPEMPNP